MQLYKAESNNGRKSLAREEFQKKEGEYHRLGNVIVCTLALAHYCGRTILTLFGLRLSPMLGPAAVIAIEAVVANDVPRLRFFRQKE